jgi:hypothetical protein
MAVWNSAAAPGNVALSCFVVTQPWLRPQHISDLFEPGAKGIVEQVGITLCGLHLRMAYGSGERRLVTLGRRVGVNGLSHWL